jgi:hypothetical protein
MVPNFQDFWSPTSCRCATRWARASVSAPGPWSSLSARLIAHRRRCRRQPRRATGDAVCNVHRRSSAPLVLAAYLPALLCVSRVRASEGAAHRSLNNGYRWSSLGSRNSRRMSET